MTKPIALAAILASLAGCGGSGGSSHSAGAQPGYYEGTITLTSHTPEGAMNVPAALTIDTAGVIHGFAYSSSAAIRFDGQKGQGTALMDGSIVEGPMPVKATTGGVTVKFSLPDNTPLMSGKCPSTIFPTVGAQAPVPAGTYTGKFAVQGNSELLDYGDATATVQADGSFTLRVSGPGIVGGGLFGGSLDSNGAITSAVLIYEGTVYSQTRTPLAGYQNGVLTLEFSNLTLDPAALVATLQASN